MHVPTASGCNCQGDKFGLFEATLQRNNSRPLGHCLNGVSTHSLTCRMRSQSLAKPGCAWSLPRFCSSVLVISATASLRERSAPRNAADCAASHRISFVNDSVQ